MAHETVEVSGIKLDVEFDYFPYERQTLEYPGSDEEIGIVEVTVSENPTDIYQLLSEEVLEEIYEKVWKKIKEY